MTQYYKGWALLHAGRWDELIRLMDEAGKMAEKNEQHRWKALFNLELAWLHEHCGAFREAQTLCELALEHVEQTGHPYTRMVAAILLGCAHLGQGKLDAGIRHLN